MSENGRWPVSGHKLVLAPNQVFQDHRLSLIQTRVLLALFSFRDNRTTKPVYPKRDTLAERAGYSPTVISRTTTELQKLGWLTKRGNGGRSSPTHYELHAPDFDGIMQKNGARIGNRLVCKDEQKTVTDQETVTGSGTVSKTQRKSTSSKTVTGSETVTGSGTKTVTGSVRGKEHINKPNEEKNRKKRKSKVEKWSPPQNLNTQAWEEFEQHRREIRKPLTDTARAKNAKIMCEYPLEVQQRMVDDAIRSRWAGVFPPKNYGARNEASNQQSSRNPSAVERTRQAANRRAEARGEPPIFGENGEILSYPDDETEILRPAVVPPG